MTNYSKKSMHLKWKVTVLCRSMCSRLPCAKKTMKVSNFGPKKVTTNIKKEMTAIPRDLLQRNHDADALPNRMKMGINTLDSLDDVAAIAMSIDQPSILPQPVVQTSALTVPLVPQVLNKAPDEDPSVRWLSFCVYHFQHSFFCLFRKLLPRTLLIYCKSLNFSSHNDGDKQRTQQR